jgi:hypothetical protein
MGFRKILEEKGVYILYKRSGKEKYKIFYIGIAGFGKGKNLFGRLKSHAKSKRRSKEWTHFRAFIIPVTERKKRFLKDIEGVLIRIENPEGNKNTPILLEEKGYQNKIKEIIKGQVKTIKQKMKDLTILYKEEEQKLKKTHKRSEQEHQKELNKYRGLLD